VQTELFGTPTRKSAVLEDTYRYSLTREWFEPDKVLPRRVLFVGLNPSTADAVQDDLTVTKCIGYARRWGYDAIDIGNLFALRSTDPRALLAAPAAAIGPFNDRHLHTLGYWASLIVCCWGDGPAKLDLTPRIGAVLRLLGGFKAPMRALGFTRRGNPRHPSRLAYATPLELMVSLLDRAEGTPEREP
jgi:hypothetical protein